MNKTIEALKPIYKGTEMSLDLPFCGVSKWIFQRITKNSDGFLCGDPNWTGSYQSLA